MILKGLRLTSLICIRFGEDLVGLGGTMFVDVRRWPESSVALGFASFGRGPRPPSAPKSLRVIKDAYAVYAVLEISLGTRKYHRKMRNVPGFRPWHSRSISVSVDPARETNVLCIVACLASSSQLRIDMI